MILCLLFFLKWFIVDPNQSESVINYAQELYQNAQSENVVGSVLSPEVLDSADPLDSSDSFTSPIFPNSSDATDSQDAFMKKTLIAKFIPLIQLNLDVKGWIEIDGTNINYPVLQPTKENPEYYLTKNIEKNEDRSGSIFLDLSSDIELPSQSLLIHGHNMSSSGTMFHELMNYKELSFLISHPTIHFDTIYEEGDWIIFAVFMTNASSEHDSLFSYQKGSFHTASEFLNFIYQIRVRSIYNTPVSITDDDQILLLSTCTYELENYRLVVAAKRINTEPEFTFDVNNVTKNQMPLYPDSWYEQYGGTKPTVSSFEQALINNEISWYQPTTP